MKKLLFLFLLACLPLYAGDTTIDGHSYEDAEVIDFNGMSAPSTSPLGDARIYFDSTSLTLKLSQNGGAYQDILSGEASDISTDTTNFDNNLSPDDDTVQKALDTLDEISVGAGSGSMTTAKEAGVQVGGADIVTLDFGAGFDLTEDPNTEINISLDLSEYSGYNNSNWDTAYGWGDHSSQNYFDKDSDTADTILPSQDGNNGKFLTTDGTNASWAADSDTTYTASGTLLSLDGTEFSINEGTLTTTKGCKYVEGTGIVCDQDYLTSEVDGSTSNELQNLFSIIAVDGQDNVEADAQTDTLTLAEGANITITTTAASDTVTIAATDTDTDDQTLDEVLTEGDTSAEGNITLTAGTLTANTITDGTFSVTGGTITGAAGSNSQWTNDAGYITATLSQEEVEDYAGAMVSGNTETLITVTYQDDDGTIDFAVDNDLSHYSNVTSAFITATLTEEEVEDYVGGMLGGTETHIAVTYQDDTNDIDFVVSDDWYDSVADIPTAAPSDDDTTHLSTANDIYDFCETTQDYLKTSENSDSDDDISDDSIGDLSDVGDATATDGNVLVADGDSWESRALTEADISDLGSYLESVDISDNTNLAGTANEITLTDDTLSLVLLKDLVAGEGLSGGANNVLIGADSDVTLSVDTTEIDGARTWGAADGNSITWTWNLIANDPSVEFGPSLVRINDNFHVGGDDDAQSAYIHSGGTLTIYDTSDDTSVVFGPVGDGTTVLDVTGTIDADGLKVGGSAVLTSESDPNVDTADEIEAILTDDNMDFGSGTVSSSGGFIGDLTGNADTATTASSATTATNVSDADKGEIVISSGVWSLDADVVGADELADGDLGDIIISGGAVSLDSDTVSDAEINFTNVTLSDFTIDVAAYDFGGVTSLEIPNAAAPTTDAAGEIALDTTIADHKPLIQYYTGSENMSVIAIPTADIGNNDNYVVKYDLGNTKFTLEPDLSGSPVWADQGAYLEPADGEYIVVGGTDQSTITEGLVINDGSGGDADDDLRVETDNEDNFLVVDASADLARIGDFDTNYVQITAAGVVTFAGTGDIDLPSNSVDSADVNFNYAASSGEAGAATTLTVTDNEDTAENNAVLFTSGGDLDGGDLGIESDGDLFYTPSTGTLTATVLTEGGNAVYNSTETPGGELGGTWASPTIDDNITVTGWVLGSSTATTPDADDNDTSLATTAFCETTQNYLKTSELAGAETDPNVDTADEVIAIINNSPTTTIKHEAGGLEADVSAYSGLVGIDSGATAEVDTEGELESMLGSINVLLETEIDASSELLAIMDDETGTGLLVFNDNPSFTSGFDVQGDNDAFIDLYRGVAASEQQIRFYNEGDSMVQAIGVTNNGTDLFFWNGSTRLTIANSGTASFQDNDIDDVGDIALDTISSDAGTTVQVTLGTDSGDDFKVYNGSNTLLQVYGDTGIVDMAKQSGCSVYLNNSGANQTGDKTETKLILDAEIYDIQNEFDSTTNYRFTATKAGIYSVSVQAQFASPVDQDRLRLIIKVNGSAVAENYMVAPAGYSTALTVPKHISLSANDYIEIYVRDVDNNLNINDGATLTYCDIHKIG